MLKTQPFRTTVRVLPLALSMCMAALCSTAALAQTPTSGIDKTQFDATVRPQDDFHQYVSGTWLKNTASLPCQPTSPSTAT